MNVSTQHNSSHRKHVVYELELSLRLIMMFEVSDRMLLSVSNILHFSFISFGTLDLINPLHFFFDPFLIFFAPSH